MDDRLRWLLLGYAALILLDLLCYPLCGVRLGRKAVSAHLIVWLVLIPLLALLGIVYPAALVLFAVVLPLLLLVNPTPVVARRGRLYLAATGASVAFMLAGIGAPLRALGLGVRLHWEPFPIDAVLAGLFQFGPRPIAIFDICTGACGVLAGAIGGTLSVVGLWRQIRQVEALPTSRARSAATGLAEFKGIARAIGPDAPTRVEESGDGSAFADLAPAWSTAILFHGTAMVSDGGKATSVSRSKRACFLLEDEGGRILVDPREAAFWDGSGGILSESAPAIHLAAVAETVPLGFRTVAQLQPGDPVYLVGSVEVDAAAAPGAADSARLVVRPRPRRRRSLLERMNLLEGPPLRADEESFFLSSSSERCAATALRTAARNSVVAALFWVIASLWLVSTQTARFTALPEGWLSATALERRAQRERAALAATLAAIGPGSKAPLPELEALLRSPEPGARRWGVSILGRLEPAEAVKLQSAIPALIEVAAAPPDAAYSVTNEVIDAITLLGSFGRRAAAAAPVLLADLEHDEPLIRLAALKALAQVAPADETTAGALAALLDDPVPGVRDEARRLLVSLPAPR